MNFFPKIEPENNLKLNFLPEKLNFEGIMKIKLNKIVLAIEPT